MYYYKIIVGIVAVVASCVGAVQAETWHMATPYPDSIFHTQNIRQFAEDVERATDGKLKIEVHSASSLIKHKAIKNAVRSQQVQIGEFFISVLANEGPVYALDSLPFIAESFADARKLYSVSKPVLAQDLGRQHLKILFSVPWPPQGLYSDIPIESIEDLQGLKFRAYNAQTERFAQLVGAVPAQVEVPDLAQAFATGRVDAMITATSTGVSTKAWDYLNYFYNISAYLPKDIVVVNKRAFNALDPEVQQGVLDAAHAAQKRGWKMAKSDNKAKLKILEQNGIIVKEGSATLMEDLRSIGKQMAQEWKARAGESGAEILEAYRAK